MYCIRPILPASKMEALADRLSEELFKEIWAAANCQYPWREPMMARKEATVDCILELAAQKFYAKCA